ncbi:hypothetical protein MKW94_018649, partial [Papaver nudicaule]|nr:hypothetical protein [Papaver nudicaule]
TKTCIWLVENEILNVIVAGAGLSQGAIENIDTTEVPCTLMDDLANNMDVSNLALGDDFQNLDDAIEASLQCFVCQKELVIDDKMQELPCKHFFQPLCLNPWLDEHNSCPDYRHELPTYDHNYESKKEGRSSSGLPGICSHKSSNKTKVWRCLP